MGGKSASLVILAARIYGVACKPGQRWDLAVRWTWAVPKSGSGVDLGAVYKLDTSSIIADVEDIQKEEPRSACLHGSTVWQSRKYCLVWGYKKNFTKIFHKKNFLEPCPMSSSLAHYLYMCVYVSIHVVYTRVYIHIVMQVCSVSSHISYLDAVLKFDWTSFIFWSLIPRVTVCQWVFLLSTIPLPGFPITVHHLCAFLL